MSKKLRIRLAKKRETPEAEPIEKGPLGEAQFEKMLAAEHLRKAKERMEKAMDEYAKANERHRVAAKALVRMERMQGK